jgi:UPF0755 protein
MAASEVRRPLLAGVGTFILALLIFVAGFLYANGPRADFPAGERISIPEGATLSEIAALLDERRVVRSAFLFRSIISMRGAHADLHAGTYMFAEPMTTSEVAYSMVTRASIAPPIRLTIPEGSNLRELDDIVADALPLVAEGEMRALAKGEEGMLFPDTYLFDETATATQVFARMRENYEEKLEPLRPRIEESGFSEAEIVILASLLEREANDERSMRMVSGILRKRLAIRMPLQVDATFAYLLGKESSELTEADLEMDSPFNTYTHYGLPPSPIGTPGLMALEAALEPIESPYLYYLTGSDGTFHYAKTFDEHKRNKALYLR